MDISSFCVLIVAQNMSDVKMFLCGGKFDEAVILHRESTVRAVVGR